METGSLGATSESYRGVRSCFRMGVGEGGGGGGGGGLILWWPHLHVLTQAGGVWGMLSKDNFVICML